MQHRKGIDKIQQNFIKIIKTPLKYKKIIHTKYLKHT